LLCGCREKTKRIGRTTRGGDICARRIIAECKRQANIRWGEGAMSEFRESKKVFSKSMNRKRTPPREA
jgi:hypothetical protein